MKTQQTENRSRRGFTLSRGFTLIELLVVISIIAILAGVAMPVLQNSLMQGRFTATASNARQIGLALRQFAAAHDGQFPLYQDSEAGGALAGNANEALEQLMPRHCSDKAIFTNLNSKWCRKAPGGTDGQYRLHAGELDWAYVRGLSETADSRWPLLATAFAPGGRTYVKDSTKPGGVWRGQLAVVLRVDGSVITTPELKDTGETTFIRRPDKPAGNMFDKDADWLSGDDIEVLLPLSN